MINLIRAEERKKCTQLRLQLIHFEVLDYLSRSNQETDTLTAIASHFGMTLGTISQSIIVLTKKGYVKKCQDTQDKRIIHIQLLPSAQTLLKKTRPTTLLNKANAILKKQSINKTVFIQTFNTLQQASFKFEPNTQLIQKKNLNIFELIQCSSALIRSEERKQCTLLKLHMIHFQILDYLSLCNQYSDTPSAITHYLGMTRGTVSQSLLVLTKKGFIQKQQDSTDKRIYHIKLLGKGLKTLKKIKSSPFLKKASTLLNDNHFITENDKNSFKDALTALQQVNNSYNFGVCYSCKHFTQQNQNFFCELTQEPLSYQDSQSICLEHTLN